MVWSLVYSSLVSIANGIKDGKIGLPNPHFLPPKLRQRVLDTVLQRRLINEPNCMSLLSSVQFLNGMESFGTEPGRYGMEFLKRLETSMATKLPNGKTVGDGITKLNLSVYGCANCILWPEFISSFPFVARLIAQCPNTTSLDLRGIINKVTVTMNDHDYLYVERRNLPCWFPSVLNSNENNACNAVMENLVELSVRDMRKILDNHLPIISFKQLTTLKLNNCAVQVGVWPEFLRNISTLKNLHLIDVRGIKDLDNVWGDSSHVNGLDWILPISMPNLEILEIVSQEYHDHKVVYECNNKFIDNLMKCPKLCRVHLMLDQHSTDEESMERLANMEIDLRVKVRFFDDMEWERRRRGLEKEYKFHAALDSSSKFKIVRIFRERIDSFELHLSQKWSPEIATALEDAIDSCPNLTTFGLCIPNESNPEATEIELNEIKRINATLLQFLGDWERAMQLKDFRLRGNIDEAVILAAFDGCLNLDRLDISSCPTVRDQHLIDWASNGGGKLKHLYLGSCQNVTNEGINAILVNSGEGLLRMGIEFCSDQAIGNGRDWKTVLKSRCPHAKFWK